MGTSDEIAIRLADEGVPLAAIARATQTPSADLRPLFARARADGRLLELPKDDWPPGFPRDQRALQLSRLASTDRAALMLRVRQLFHLTATEFNLFLALLQLPAVRRVDHDPDVISVHIHHLRRRLAPFGLAIVNLWGEGYQFLPADRRRAMDLVLGRRRLKRALPPST